MSVKEIKLSMDSEALHEIIYQSLVELCIDEAESMIGDDYLYCYLMTLTQYAKQGDVKEVLKKINDTIISEEFKSQFEDIKYWNDHLDNVQKVTNKFLIEYYGSIE